MTKKLSQFRVLRLSVFIFLFVFKIGNVLFAQTTYHYQFTYDGNPLVRNHGAADPDVHVWNDTICMYTSQDHDGGYKNMDGYHAFSSTDMINWTDHGEILHSREVDWGLEDGGYMWAPGAARKNGKYYLYYPHRDKSDNYLHGFAEGSYMHKKDGVYYYSLSIEGRNAR